MSEKKPIPVLVERDKRICPICGKRSYSAAGVHPQCAVIQADAPRKLKLASEKAALAKRDKKEGDRKKIHAWQKVCPKCQLRIAAQQPMCRCGHHFGGL